MSGSLTLITGGARSGKSTLAERLAARAGNRVTYVATCEPLDDEMRQRIRAHRERRPRHWVTLEEPLAVDQAVLLHGPSSDAVIVDCLGLWVTNILLRQPPDAEYRERCEEVLRSAANLVQAAGQVSSEILVVSNEVGSGLVPENVLGRIFRDSLGWANQVVAAAAQRVYLTVAGIPLEVKALGTRL